jgi:hypothetical protein
MLHTFYPNCFIQWSSSNCITTQGLVNCDKDNFVILFLYLTSLKYILLCYGSLVSCFMHMHLLPPFINIRCFRFVNQMYLDKF